MIAKDEEAAEVATLLTRLVDERPDVLQALRTLITALLSDQPRGPANDIDRAAEQRARETAALKVAHIESACTGIAESTLIVDDIDISSRPQLPLERIKQHPVHALPNAQDHASLEALMNAVSFGPEAHRGLLGGLTLTTVIETFDTASMALFTRQSESAQRLASAAGAQRRRLQAIRKARHHGNWPTLRPDNTLAKLNLHDWTLDRSLMEQLTQPALKEAGRWYGLLADAATELEEWFLRVSVEQLYALHQPQFRAAFTERVECLAIAQRGVLEWIESRAKKARLKSTQFCGVQALAFETLSEWLAPNAFAVFLDRGMKRDRPVTAREREEMENRLIRLSKSAVDVEEPEAEGPLAEAMIDSESGDETTPHYSGVFEAVTAAQQDFGQQLTFHERAFESATDSAFRRPDEVHGCLRALAKIASDRARGKFQGTPLSQLFLTHGLRLKFSSDATMTRYANRYFADHCGARVSLSEHVTLGARSQNTCLSIHWWFDSSTDKFLVLHCGKHLPNSLS